ncbi:hypothetical protein C6497_15050 [Candidatus Poribacteria bacterium]|nr:MAG: hypothetical protein C6497_15050 [Candidatus Poribacteria bacterium]
MKKTKIKKIYLLLFYAHFFCLFPVIFAQDLDDFKETLDDTNLVPKKTDFNLLDSALNLDGNESYVEITDSKSLNNITKHVTVSLWIKPTAYPHEYANILFKGNRRLPGITHRQFTFWFWHDGSISFDTSPDGNGAQYLVPDTIVKLNTWTFITGVIDVDKDVMRVLINGVEVERRSFRGEERMLKTSLPLRIGRSHEEERPCHSPFVGQIDDVSVWNLARSNKEIRSDMISQPKGTEDGLVGYWNFDNVDNGLIRDLSVNQNHGRMVGNAQLKKYIQPYTKIGFEEYHEVSSLYEEFLNHNTRYYDTYRYLAEIYSQSDRLLDAERVYLHSLKEDFLQDEYNDALSNLRTLYYDRDAVTEFINLLENLKPEIDNNPFLYELLGDAYQNADIDQKAEISYMKWVDLLKSNVNNINQSEVLRQAAEKLLNVDLLPELALDLASMAIEKQIHAVYHLTLIKAFLTNDRFENVFQHIHWHSQILSSPFYEKQIYMEIVKAGKNIEDKNDYILMLNQLIEDVSLPITTQEYSLLALAQFYSENDMPDKSHALIKNTGYIIDTAWMLLGPFDSLGGLGIDKEYINEHLPKMDFSLDYMGKYGQEKWRIHTDEFVDNNIQIPDNDKWGVYYAYSTVNSPGEQDIEIQFSGDEYSKLWVNGLLVFQLQNRNRNDDKYRIPVTLHPGNNSILVKICELRNGRGFSLQITNQNGEPTENLDIIYPTE